ncbi:hypothetical protein [Bacillus luti]|uniref:hypothetical protein n=1 Tax=Bacillus luti TaxID=2026191 RepID=UPI003770ADA5
METKGVENTLLTLKERLFSFEIDYLHLRMLILVLKRAKDSWNKELSNKNQRYSAGLLKNIELVNQLLQKLDAFLMRIEEQDIFVQDENHMLHRVCKSEDLSELLHFIGMQKNDRDRYMHLLELYTVKEDVDIKSVEQLGSELESVLDDCLSQLNGIEEKCGVKSNKLFSFRKKSITYSYVKEIVLIKEICKTHLEYLVEQNEEKSSNTVCEEKVCELNPVYLSVEKNGALLKWINHRIIDKYLDGLITTITTEVEENEESKDALKYNAEKINKEYCTLDEWKYLGSFFFECLEECGVNDLEDIALQEMHPIRQSILQEVIKMEDLVCSIAGSKQQELEDIYEGISRKAILIVDYLSAYSIELTNASSIGKALNFEGILNLLGIEKITFKEGERLLLDECQTVEVIETEDIRLDFTIKQVVNLGIRLNSAVHRKAAVTVYRLVIEKEDENV